MHLGALERTEQIHKLSNFAALPVAAFVARAQVLQMEEKALYSAKCDKLLQMRHDLKAGTHANDSMLQTEEVALNRELT